MGGIKCIRHFMLFASIAAPCLVEAGNVKRQATTHTTSPPGSGVTAVSDCHIHESTQYCMHDETEFQVLVTPTATQDLPASYTDCHAHATETWCISPDGGEVEIALAAEETHAVTTTEDHEDHDHTETAAAPTAISDCHLHETEIFCMVGTTEYIVLATPTSSEVPPQYTGCHSHGSETFCVDPSGDDVQIELAGAEHAEEEETSPGQTCHFHAGVEHCVDAEGVEEPVTCTRTDRDYNIRLRVGLLFVILVTSSIGVFGPIFLSLILPPKASAVLLVIKQFGTGVIISTAFVHLYTHASLMFTNECLRGVDYEGTTAAILMAGIFLSFLVEFAGQRLVHARHVKLIAANQDNLSSSLMAEMKLSNEIVSVVVLEAGIVFHSLLIGLTLVVAGDSYFLTLFAVILFHQMFEGIALGTRIAALGTASPLRVPHGHLHSHSHSHNLHRLTHSSSHNHNHGTENNAASEPADGNTSSEEDDIKPIPVPLSRKLMFATVFAFVTPIGMAIGIGVLNVFNGNDPSTLIAIGTLDALSAGILVWVGVVEMWAEDWMFGGELTYASTLTTILGGLGLVLGMAIMSLLGKWA
ncbi:hypothetical protein ABW19_dt0201767 [Dactylella cylindrospora]|nr:hypothetical protein ABW19_dt0201767 [Dactylella cylindrospora]